MEGVSALTAIGFDEGAARIALEAAGGDVALAADLLAGSMGSTFSSPTDAVTHDTRDAVGVQDVTMEADNQWACLMCTVMNVDADTTCQVCGSLRSGVALPVPDTAGDSSGRFDPANAKKPKSSRLPKREKVREEHKRKYRKLRRVLMAMPTLKRDEEVSGEVSVEVPQLSGGEVMGKLKELWPPITSRMCRRGQTPVLTLISMSMQTGLPILNAQPALLQHTTNALRFILGWLCDEARPRSKRVATLQRLADAFQSCQAEQCRVIDAIYGALMGRDRSFRDQVRALVDAKKELVMEATVTFLNPDALMQDDNIPQKQVPHLSSAYRVAIGHALGLHGVEVARMDVNAPPQQELDPALIWHTFERLFSIRELVEELIGDVNQQSAEAERTVSRDDLGRWAGNAAENNGFESHSIFFEEEYKKERYNDEEPLEENAYQPFLWHDVALDIFMRLFALDNNAEQGDDEEEDADE